MILATQVGDLIEDTCELVDGIIDAVVFAPLEVLERRKRACDPCRIPPPCWMPELLGESRSRACPGETASLRLKVINCGPSTRNVTLGVVGGPVGAQVVPATMTLGPLQSAHAVVSWTVPPAAAFGEEHQMQVWVNGCRQHMLEWEVKVGRCSQNCEGVRVMDCPDTIHHWYDHFYCQHPCQHHA
jgi:hypothetical protein